MSQKFEMRKVRENVKAKYFFREMQKFCKNVKIWPFKYPLWSLAISEQYIIKILVQPWYGVHIEDL